MKQSEDFSMNAERERISEAAIAEEKREALQKYGYLLTDLKALKPTNYHKMNEHAGRNDRLLHAVLCAYAKHHMDCPDIGWNELDNILHSAICNEISSEVYCEWIERVGEAQ